RVADLRKRLDVLRRAGLLEPIGRELRERIDEIDGVHWRKAPVDLDEHSNMRADSIANRTCDLDGAPYVILRDVSPTGAGNGIEFQRGESALEHCFSAAGIVLRQLHLVAPAVRVDADARTAGTPEKIVDWLLRDLSGDVPQRLLNARHGTIELQRAPSLRVVIKRNLRHVADVERVAANKITAEFFDLRGDCTVPGVLGVGLAPSADPPIRLEPPETKLR